MKCPKCEKPMYLGFNKPASEAECLNEGCCKPRLPPSPLATFAVGENARDLLLGGIIIITGLPTTAGSPYYEGRRVHQTRTFRVDASYLEKLS